MSRDFELWVAENRPARGKVRKWRVTDFVFKSEREARVWFGKAPLKNWRIRKYVPRGEGR